MADTNTALLNLLIMAVDSHNNDWGTQTSANLAIIARAIAGTVSHAVTTGTVTLTRDNVVEQIHRVTGVLVGNVIIEVPAAEAKHYVWRNETTGAFTVTVKVTGQTGVLVPQGDTKLLRCNGTDVVDVGLASLAAIGGLANWVGTMAFAADAYSTAANNYLGAALYDGLTVTAYFADANATVAPTYNYAASGAKGILHADGTAPAIGDIVAGMVGSLTYKSSTGKWYLSTPAASLLAKLNAANTFAADKTQTINGRLIEANETLTDAATIAWDMADRPNIVKILLSASRALGAPTNMVTGQQGLIIVQQDGTGGWSLTPNAIFKQAGGQTVFDQDKTANARTLYEYEVIEDSTATKQVLIRRRWSEGSSSIGFFKEYDLGAFVVGTQYLQTHGLGRYPSLVQCYIECTTSEFGYAIGGRVEVGSLSDGANNNRKPTVFSFTTTAGLRTAAAGTPFVMDASFAQQSITAASWKVILRVYE